VGKILVIAWAVAFAAAAEPDEPRYAVRRWTSNEGLPQNTVYALCQQGDGTLVVATEEGVASFDGRTFRHIASDWLENQGRRFVNALLSHENGLWIGTLSDGVIHQATAAPRVTTHILQGAYVKALAKDWNGDVWIGTTGGVSRVRKDNPTSFAEKDGYTGGGIHALAITGDTVWAGAANGLWRFNGTRWNEIPSLAGRPIFALSIGAANRLWFATGDGELGRLDTADRTDQVVPVGKVGRVHALLEDRLGSLWIASMDGLFRYQDRLRPVPGLEEVQVGEALALLEDAEHDIWVGLQSGGLLRLRQTAVTVIGKEAGLRSENVLSVTGDDSGTLWAGTDGAGLAQLRDGRVVARFDQATGLPGNTVTTVILDGRSGAYVGLAERGVLHVKDGRASRPPELEALAEQSVYALLQDDRKRLWMGTHDQGVYWLNEDRLEHIALPGERVFALEKRRAGGIWVGTSKGLALVHDGSVKKRHLAGTSVLTLHEDASGILWIGTGGSGLHWLDGEKQGSASRAQGLVSDIVFQILEELPSDGGGLWMSCNHGLFRADKNDLFALQEKRIERIDVDTITHDDGMKSVEANGGKQPAGWRAPDGALWFATVSGVTRVEPRLFAATRNTEPPVVRIDAVLADGAVVADPGARTTVPPGRGRLEIRYAATSLASPTSIRYQHRLVGFDDDWIEAGEQVVAQYTNLPPGEYQFEVKAARGRFWSEVKSTGTFELLPQFHQTWWFRVAVAVAVILLGVAAYRARVRRWQAETMVLAERNRLAREIHDGLMQSLTGILIQLQAAVSLWSSGRERPLGHVERALEWARYSMADARLAVTSLGREVASVKVLSEVLLRCAEALTSGTTVRAEVRATSETPLPPKIGAALLRIGQEAMGNAVRHGRPKSILVEITTSNGEIRMAVRDDGRGFDASEAVSSSSNGLRNMRERAQAIGARHELRSAPGKGTEVIVEAPLSPVSQRRLRRS